MRRPGTKPPGAAQSIVLGGAKMALQEVVSRHPLFSPHPEEPAEALAKAGVSKGEGACTAWGHPSRRLSSLSEDKLLRMRAEFSAGTARREIPRRRAPSSIGA